MLKLKLKDLTKCVETLLKKKCIMLRCHESQISSDCVSVCKSYGRKKGGGVEKHYMQP